MKSYIPTIDISSLLNLEFSTLKAKNTIRKIEKACVDIGFFQVTGHGININTKVKVTLSQSKLA